MSTITTRDGTEIYYKDWGSGQPVVFGHGWPLDGDMWEYQMNFLAERGYRVIAYDRRGFGRSSQPWSGYNYDTFADDLAELMDKLDLQGATLVGFSMGGGDVARYIGRHGTKRVAKAALLGAVTPIFGQAPDFPQGVPAEVFAGINEGLLKDRAQFISDFAAVFFGTNRPGKANAVSAGVLAQTFNIAMLASLKGTLDCVTAFSGTDFREDIKKFNFPTLVIHGDDDQIVPFQTTGKLVAEMVPGAQLKIYGGAPHALCATHKDQINEDLLAFLKGVNTMSLDATQRQQLEKRRLAPLATPGALSELATQEIGGALTMLLADIFALYLKTKNFHWHMSGPHFRDYHLLLDDQSGQIIAITDAVAERVRKIGATTLRSTGHVGRLQRLADNDADFVTPSDMLAELREDNLRLVGFMMATHALCDEHGDVATASLLENWIDEAEQRAWFLFESGRTSM